ncbi:MAG: DUF1028 domain-containing protein [Ignavibacteriae bacterium]|nr:DUF1028 domain-containing protein [Ignavibacteria bacterium]MBI3363735.1 DUF1028 domain-containing protein [Ignavibacteriota bacterium]
MKHRSYIVAFLVLIVHFGFAQTSIERHDVVATYSIVAWDSATGDLGVAVQSKFLGVGAVVPFAKAGVGAVATQAFANTTYGPRGLALLDSGMMAQQVVEALTQNDSDRSRRQVGIVDAHGNAFAYTGSGCQPYAGHVTGRGYTAQGNILAGEQVVKAIARTFEITQGDLADRLLAALDAGENAGGDKRGRQSAALLVVRDAGGYGGFNDRYVDIRVDDDSLPLVVLRRIYNKWRETFLLEARMRTIDEFNRQRKFDAAREETKRVAAMFNDQLRTKPDDPDLLNSIAWSLATHDIDRVRALELAKRAVTLAPDKLNILDTLAECHYRLGHYDEAIAIEAELVKKEPANDEYWKQLQKFKDAREKAGH